jgi:hypothetical protein
MTTLTRALVAGLGVTAIAVVAPMPAARAQTSGVATAGSADILYYDPTDINFAHGPSGATLGALGPLSSTITVDYDANFTANPSAQAAFAGAVNVWAHLVASPATIRVRASYVPLAADVLASAGPTALCTVPEYPSSQQSHVLYPAALADARTATQNCAARVGETHEITIALNSGFALWDFGTSGTGVAGQVNFMTAVMHGLAHGLGIISTASSDGTLGRRGTPYAVFDSYPRTSGRESSLTFAPNPSTELHALLTGDNLFFDPTELGVPIKLDVHNFATFYGIGGTANGWLPGVSLIHLDELTYNGTPNGLMTWGLGHNEVYTDPGPMLRAMLRSLGWTVRQPVFSSTCSYGLSEPGTGAAWDATSGTFTLHTQGGCSWTAVSDSPSWLWVERHPVYQSGVGSAVIVFRTLTNTAAVPRTGTIKVAGLTFTVTQQAACTFSLTYNSFTVSAFGSGGVVDVQTRPDCSWTAVNNTPSVVTLANDRGMGPGTVVFSVTANASTSPRFGSLRFGEQLLSVRQEPAFQIPPVDMDGDAKADPAGWNPQSGRWGWQSALGPQLKQWGNGTLGDLPLIGDMDGDGLGDLIVWRASTGTWYWLTSSTGYDYAHARGLQWGNASLGDQPMLADMDGDGLADLVVWRASTGTWYWLTSSSGYHYGAAQLRQWGNTTLGDWPMLADLDGDSRADLVVWRATTATWYWIASADHYDYDRARGIQWGVPGYVPVLADFDGDQRADLMAYRPVGVFSWLTSSTSYDPAAARLKGISGNFGSTTQHVVADFDGDGRGDPGWWTVHTTVCSSTVTWGWWKSSTDFSEVGSFPNSRPAETNCRPLAALVPGRSP